MSKIVPRTLLRHELIGLEARVIDSVNSGYIGIKGRIVDETRNTLIISQEGRDKVIVKENTLFHLSLPDEVIVEVEGRYLVGRPQDRVKRKSKTW